MAKKREREEGTSDEGEGGVWEVAGGGGKKRSKVVGEEKGLSAEMKSQYVGLDCEMVGMGVDGKQSALARCCAVNWDGEVIYDSFVRPKGFVTDFRTQWSGVRRQDIIGGATKAVTFEECQEQVARLLKGKILVGHALKNDLDVLMLKHPRTHIRDTAWYRPFMRPHGSKFRSCKLKELAKQHLKMEIQTGEHDPHEDAKAAIFLYKAKRKEWEASIKERSQKAKVMVKHSAVSSSSSSSSSSAQSLSESTTVAATTKVPKVAAAPPKAASSSMFASVASISSTTKSTLDVDREKKKKSKQQKIDKD